ncbi:hypothetical protein KY359_06395 [Candidatus Woesearchaeota archaeon]|nr:hypothetical protein [Candidatus Woesearchaeota archaeon]
MASYDLDKIVGDLDPGKINKKVELGHRKARNKYALKDVQIEDYNAFLKEATKYLQHHHKQVFGSDLPEHVASGKVREALDQIYKKQGGIVGAYKEAKKGNMAKVIDSLADAMESEERSHYVQHVMNQIDPQDFDGHVQLAKQYKGKFGNLLPKDLKTKSPEQLAHNYAALIDHHISVVESVKSQLKKYEPAKKAA